MTATVYRVTLTAEEPLRLGAGTVGQIVKTQPHVPGSVLRGALAARWIAAHGPPNTANVKRQEFLELFEGAVRFGPLLPEGGALVPLAVATCRYVAQPKCREELLDEAHPTGDSDEGPRRCRVCKGPLEPGKGQIRGGARPLDAMHAPLNDGEVAKEGALHSREYLPAGARFNGAIIGSHPWLDEAKERQVWVGGRRSVGGLATMTLERDELETPEARDDVLHLELQSPGVFVDDAGRAMTTFPTHEIARVLERPEPHIERSWVRMTNVAGWHAASGLPKPVDQAVAAGSSALLSFTDGGVSEEERRRLAARGLGLRRSEGFGWVAVNPPRRQPTTLGGGADASAQPSDLAAHSHPALNALNLLRKERGGEGFVNAALLERVRKRGIERMHKRRTTPAADDGDHTGDIPSKTAIERLSARELDDLVALLELEQSRLGEGGR